MIYSGIACVAAFIAAICVLLSIPASYGITFAFLLFVFFLSAEPFLASSEDDDDEDDDDDDTGGSDRVPPDEPWWPSGVCVPGDDLVGV